MLWLAVHLPMFALETSQAGQPAQTPTVLVDGSRVVLGNRAALSAGIRPQSTLATAHGICPQLIHYRRDAGKERKRLRLLAEMCYRFTSRVSIEPSQGARIASGLLLEAGGSLKLFGDLRRWQAQVATLCRSLGHAAVLRPAATPSAALALARAGLSRLDDVPLAHTELDESDVESLFNMGIGKLGALLQLPEVELGPRFGTGLTNYLQRLTGKAPDSRHCIEPAPVFASSLHLLDPITDKEALLFPMQRLLTELEHWLIARQLGTARLLWHFAPFEVAGRVALPVRFAAPRQRKAEFIDIVRLALNRAELPENVLEIGLQAQSLMPWTTHTQTLFEHPPQQQGGWSLQPGSARGHPSHEKVQPGSARGHPSHEKVQPGSARGHPSHEKAQPGSARGLSPHTKPQSGGTEKRSPHEPHAPSELIDRFTAHLGETACFGVAVTGQHIPERAWRRCQTGAGGELPNRHDGIHRPLWFFESPLNIKRETLEILSGPERLQTGWWVDGGCSHARGAPPRSPAEPFHARGAPSRSPAEGSFLRGAGPSRTPAEGSYHRDYYVVRCANGARGWAFVDADGRWFLHGYFG